MKTIFSPREAQAKVTIMPTLPPLPPAISLEELKNTQTTGNKSLRNITLQHQDSEYSIAPFSSIAITSTSTSDNDNQNCSSLHALSVGSPIWGLDTLIHESYAYILVGTHSPSLATKVLSQSQWTSSSTPDLDQNKNKSSLVQLWMSEITSIPEPDFKAFRLMYAIQSAHGDVLDIQWEPECSATKEAGRALVVSEDGTAQVFVLPLWTQLQAAYLLEETTVVVNKTPIPQYTLPSEKSIFLTARWSCPPKSDTILAGALDGSITLWHLTREPEIEPSSDLVAIAQKWFIPVEALAIDKTSGWAAIRAIEWCPHDPNIFATLDQQDTVRIWDQRYTQTCLRSNVGSNDYATAMKWAGTHFPQCLFVAGDNNTVSFLDILESARAGSIPNYCTTWDVALVQEQDNGTRSVYLTCESGGQVFLHANKKTMKKGLTKCLLKISAAEQHVPGKFMLERDFPIGTSGAKKTIAGSFVSNDVAIHRVSCLTVPNIGRHFVICGGQAGMLLCQEITPIDLVQAAKESGAGAQGPMKKRGRPRKHPVVVRDLASEKPKRGRPRKQPTDCSSASAAAASAETPKRNAKRGRPRKSQNNEDTDTDEDPEIPSAATTTGSQMKRRQRRMSTDIVEDAVI